MTTILMIDNYDSFTYNIVHYIETIDGVTIEIVQPHDLDVLDKKFDGIIISPGPSHPKDRSDVALFVEKHFDKPILGVCLGHQLLWHMTGGVVTRGERPIHGHVSSIKHDGQTLFKDLPNPFNVTRYHSLVTKGLNDTFKVSASTSDGVIMGIRHESLPIFGVQYHPEAILSEHGKNQFKQFIDLVKERANHESTC